MTQLHSPEKPGSLLDHMRLTRKMRNPKPFRDLLFFRHTIMKYRDAYDRKPYVEYRNMKKNWGCVTPIMLYLNFTFIMMLFRY